ncbi:MAG: hypothetical protein EYC62_09450 [Alphaproteobacteria bacterium]|nr:MAG: hypothetical protein EYC62_09450 [Alphaproteobacteria bacterium]
MKLQWLTINKWLLRSCAVMIGAFLPIFAAPYLQIFFYQPQEIVVQSDFAANSDFDIMADISRNMFDPSGQTWQASMRKPKVKGAGGPQVVGEVNGLINIPGVKGVMAGNKFVPVGGSVDGGSLESVDMGQIKINTPQGTKEIDINQNRNQLRQSINIQIR